MPNRTQGMNLESLHAITSMVAQQQSLESVLEAVVESLVENSDTALARIWLVRPGDICDECVMREECPDRARCLHLVASAARPANPDSGDQWHRKDGFYRRYPLGIRRIGWIGQHGKPLRLTDTADDEQWFARDDWLHQERVRTFSGHPLIFRDEILGVLAVFSRDQAGDREFAWLHAFADSAAVAIANARAFEQIEALRSQLELENRVPPGRDSHDVRHRRSDRTQPGSETRSSNKSNSSPGPTPVC